MPKDTKETIANRDRAVAAIAITVVVAVVGLILVGGVLLLRSLGASTPLAVVVILAGIVGSLLAGKESA